MALLHTPLADTDFQAPDFTLTNIDGRALSYDDIKGENGIVIAFISNHCPYVKAIITRFVETAKQLQSKGIGVVAIMPNDTEKYPDDSFDNMKKFATQHGLTFPYLIDETQNTARQYDAICTPDIFGFDKNNQLQYRGRLDSAGPDIADDHTETELLNAMTEIIETGTTTAKQHSSMGCSIKWR